jgi:hypothetical protein
MAVRIKLTRTLPVSTRQPLAHFGFRGTVPAELAYEYSSPEYLKIALNYDEAFACSAAKRDGGIFKTHSWATREEATAAATTLGLQVT